MLSEATKEPLKLPSAGVARASEGGLQYKIELLGDVRVTCSDEPIPLGGAMPRRLLAALVVDAPRVVPTATLIERLWGDRAPTTARTALQVHVNRLRRALEPNLDGMPWTAV